MTLTSDVRRTWLVRLLFIAVAVLVLIPVRAPYITFSGISASEIVAADTETRWCTGRPAGEVTVGARPRVLFDAVNERECANRRLRNERVAIGLLVVAVVLLRRSAPRDRTTTVQTRASDSAAD